MYQGDYRVVEGIWTRTLPINQNLLDFFCQLVHVERLLDESIASAPYYLGCLTVNTVAT